MRLLAFGFSAGGFGINGAVAFRQNQIKNDRSIVKTVFLSLFYAAALNGLKTQLSDFAKEKIFSRRDLLIKTKKAETFGSSAFLLFWSAAYSLINLRGDAAFIV